MQENLCNFRFYEYKNADLEKFITKQLNKWLGRKINDLWNLDSDSENKRKDFKIDISIKKVEHIPFHLELDFFRDESNWKKIGKKIGEAIRKIIDSNDD